MVGSFLVRTLRGFLMVPFIIITLVTHKFGLMLSIAMFTKRHELNVLKNFFDIACWLVVEAQ